MVSLKISFHPVGQGLFSSGNIYINGLNVFKYIYDCGTSSTQQLLNLAIKNYRRSTDTDVIDMVAISHFDKDHISGLEKLLAYTEVRVLLLPMLSLEQRLAIAFAENVAIDSKYMLFLIDPTGYISSLPNVKIRHILMVPPSSAQASSRDPEMIGANQTDNIENWPEGLSADLEVNYSRSGPTNVHKLKPGGRLIVRKIFEFVPYNDASIAPVERNFANKVNSEAQILTNGLSSASDIKLALARLNEYYNEKYGSNSFARNVISLFLYASDLSKSHHLLMYSFARCAIVNSNQLFILSSEKKATLYTGDGYLNTAHRFNSLKKFLGNQRIDNIGCLQVMHHGSKCNWYKGVAKKLSPAVSVFSSDPSNRRLQHPDAEVVKDFMPYQPIQVDKDNGVTIAID